MDGSVFYNSSNRHWRLLVASIFTIWGSPSALSQTVTPTSQTTLDPAAWVSPRAQGMGGAISTCADNMDAMYYNPAGIGGQIYGGKAEKEPFVRQVVFPRAGVSANENAAKLNGQFSSSGATADAEAGAAIIKDHQGEREYGRASLSPVGLFLGRVGVVPVVDHQIAALPQNTDDSDVEFRYRSFSGLLVGTSVADPKGFLSLGVSTQIGTISETYGTLPYTDMVDVTARNEFLKANEKTYKASGINAGMIMRLPNKGNPSISVVARNMGTTKNPVQTGGGEPLKIQEDLTAGFGLSPNIGKWGHLNLDLESGYLTDKHTAGKKKIRGGVELLLGGRDSRALLGLRAGGTSAGASFGAHINLGLIGVEASSSVVDIGVDNDRVIERRNSASVYVDVASF